MIYIVDIVSIAVLIGIVVLLVWKGVKNLGDWYLLASTIVLVTVAGLESFSPDSYEWHASALALNLTVGPLLITYIYFQAKRKLFVPWWVFGILPVGIVSFLVFGLITGEKEWEYHFSPVTIGLEFIAFIASLAYAIYSVLAYEKIKHSQVRLDGNMRVWMITLIACYLSGILIECIYIFVYAVTDDNVYLWLADTTISFLIVSILLIQGIRTKVLLRSLPANAEEATSRWEELYQGIHNKVVVEQLFLQQDLRVDDLARIMQSNAKYISKAVNEGSGESVTNYLNGLRLDHFKKKLSDEANTHINLFALAEECGFSSKSSFNRFFKLREGVTPSEYRDSII